MRISSNLTPPTFPSTFWDIVPFLCAGLLALLFTALLVFLVEDAADETLPRTSLPNSNNKRIVGLAELPYSEKDTEQGQPTGRGRDDELIKMMRSYRPYGYPNVPKKLLASQGDTQTSLKQQQKSIPRPPQQQTVKKSSTGPMLSMAKLIMHRHDQANKRARRARSQPQATPAQPEMQQTTPTTTTQLPVSVVIQPMKENQQPPSPPPFPYQHQQPQPQLAKSTHRVTITRPSSLRAVSL